MTERVLSVVKNFDQVDPTKVNPETKFTDDLGLDSLDVVEVVMAIEDEFAIDRKYWLLSLRRDFRLQRPRW